MDDVKANSERLRIMQSALGAKALPAAWSVVAVKVSKMARVANDWRLISGRAKIAGNTPFPLSVKSRTTPCCCMRQRTQPPICSDAHVPSFQIAPRCSAPSCTSRSIFSLHRDRDRASAAAARAYPSVPVTFPVTQTSGALHPSSLLLHWKEAKTRSSLDAHV